MLVKQKGRGAVCGEWNSPERSGVDSTQPVNNGFFKASTKLGYREG